MNILLIYPEFPDTFWSFKYALKFVGKRASLPPEWPVGINVQKAQAVLEDTMTAQTGKLR